MQLTEVSIMAQPVYRIRRTYRKYGRAEHKYFSGNRQQCARRIAWWYVWDKYGSMNGDEQGAKIGKLCECIFDPNGWENERLVTTDCPLHDRTNGYLVRLARRMERFVLASFDTLRIT